MSIGFRRLRSHNRGFVHHPKKLTNSQRDNLTSGVLKVFDAEYPLDRFFSNPQLEKRVAEAVCARVAETHDSAALEAIGLLRGHVALIAFGEEVTRGILKEAPWRDLVLASYSPRPHPGEVQEMPA